MRNATGIILAGMMALLAAAPARAGDQPVVVELFTSQGCSSCPPADALLAELAQRPDVLALALHVDYWDYIGWRDTFAKPRHTARQKGYARTAGTRMIYTPQMIVGGSDPVVGTKPMEVAELIEAHRARVLPVALTVELTGRTLRLTARALRPLRKPAVVQLLRYIPRQKVEITRGENAGRAIAYHNIVTGWDELREWDGARALDMTVQLPADDAAHALLIQERDQGPVLAAARID